MQFLILMLYLLFGSIIGNKASATVQPFLLLHLDIFPDAVQTLDDALHLFSTPESLEGYRTTAGKVLTEICAQ